MSEYVCVRYVRERLDSESKRGSEGRRDAIVYVSDVSQKELARASSLSLALCDSPSPSLGRALTPPLDFSMMMGLGREARDGSYIENGFVVAIGVPGIREFLLMLFCAKMRRASLRCNT